ncbi:MAG: peptidoglycan-binding protein [Sphingobacteriales bacterium]|nr:peptidoglycan-binding protein [Sphingobacteriales bacterium]
MKNLFSLLWVLPFMVASAQGVSDDLPPNPEFGKCYAKCKIPDCVVQTTESVMTKAASKRVEIIPARYETRNEQVLVKEASRKLVVVPATYETVSEQILLKPAEKKLTEVPATYENVSEQILVSPESGRWVKKKVDPSCLSANPEDCMVQCYEKTPAQYKTITKRVTKTPATTKEVEIPAEYKTVTKQVIKTPATTKEVEIPAEYKTITKQVEVEPARTREIEIPAEYTTIKSKIVADNAGYTNWYEVVCARDMSDGLVKNLQEKLQAQGYDVGTIDGIMGSKTKNALVKYQQDHKLPIGNLNKETMAALGL